MSADDFDRFADTQRAVPFDLDRGPLVRIHAGRTGPNEVALLVGLHHISIDAGTFDVLWRQVIDRYLRGRLPELTCTYAEHAEWQRGRRHRRHGEILA